MKKILEDIPFFSQNPDKAVSAVERIVTDNSLNLCRELYGNNDRVKIVQQPVNHDPGAARNRGIKEADGKYMAFLDSDDEIMPDTFRPCLQPQTNMRQMSFTTTA